MNSEIYLNLLQNLIKNYSPSGEEDQTAEIISDFLRIQDIPTERLYNNIVVTNKGFKKGLPLVVLNSHHDTVDIGNGWTKDPTGGEILDQRIYGRGSNDAGGALVGLIAAFCHYFQQDLSYNLMLIASGEEENSGVKGVSAVLKEYDLQPDLAIIGEPTGMELGIAEKGLMVIDAVTSGISGHAARDVGVNALYLALEDIEWIKNHKWKRQSEILGEVKTTVTQIQAGSQHNVIPDACNYVIDCRVNDQYTLEDILSKLNENTHASLTPRSMKWRPSAIAPDHPFVNYASSIGFPLFGSPTLSDQIHFDCPSVKIGPGISERSHTPDEFIEVEELLVGIEKYIALLDGIKPGML